MAPGENEFDSPGLTWADLNDVICKMTEIIVYSMQDYCKLKCCALGTECDTGWIAIAQQIIF